MRLSVKVLVGTVGLMVAAWIFMALYGAIFGPVPYYHPLSGVVFIYIIGIPAVIITLSYLLLTKAIEHGIRHGMRDKN